MIRRREPGHVQPGSGDDRPGEPEADAGDLGEPLRRGQHHSVRSRAGGRDAVRGDTPGGGNGVQRGLDLVLDLGGQPVQQGDVVQVDADQHRVVLAHEHALQRLGDRGGAALDVAVRPGRQGPGVALAGDDGFQDVAGRLVPGHRVDRRRQLDQGPLQQLFRLLVTPGPLPDQPGARPGVVPQLADRRRGYEAGPQQPRPGQPGQPHRVQLVFSELTHPS